MPRHQSGRVCVWDYPTRLGKTVRGRVHESKWKVILYLLLLTQSRAEEGMEP